MRPKLFFQALLGIVSTGAIIMIMIVYFFGDNTTVVEKVIEKEVIVYRDAPAAVTPTESQAIVQQPVDTPTAAPVVPTETPTTAPAANETVSAVTSSGDIIELPADTNRLQYFIDFEATPILSEYFHGSFEATVVGDKEIMIIIWDSNLDSDIDAIRSGNMDAIKAWRSFVENDSLTLSDKITWALRGYVPGAYATVVLVDSRDHNDILYVSSFGSLFYDFESDDGLEPFYLYNQWKEKNGNA